MTIPSTTPLRQRMIEDMQARNLGHDSQRCHIAQQRRAIASGVKEQDVFAVLNPGAEPPLSLQRGIVHHIVIDDRHPDTIGHDSEGNRGSQGRCRLGRWHRCVS